MKYSVTVEQRDTTYVIRMNPIGFLSEEELIGQRVRVEGFLEGHFNHIRYIPDDQAALYGGTPEQQHIKKLRALVKALTNKIAKMKKEKSCCENCMSKAI